MFSKVVFIHSVAMISQERKCLFDIRAILCTHCNDEPRVVGDIVQIQALDYLFLSESMLNINLVGQN